MDGTRSPPSPATPVKNLGGSRVRAPPPSAPRKSRPVASVTPVTVSNTAATTHPDFYNHPPSTGRRIERRQRADRRARPYIVKVGSRMNRSTEPDARLPKRKESCRRPDRDATDRSPSLRRHNDTRSTSGLQHYARCGSSVFHAHRYNVEPERTTLSCRQRDSALTIHFGAISMLFQNWPEPHEARRLEQNQKIQRSIFWRSHYARG